ncbi:MAG: 3-phosphoserine/phosphohydroxythreonine transaminase [Anaerovoracaceae bacterium]|jgi:phosphoserine aminotransferase|nr:3-phosphoserine/phosphohydroxythreonine transaminase [Anaerovoracaceae bacterium]
MNDVRVFNFAAGPSQLPLEVLEEASKELINYKGSGQSVMEMSHRSKEFEEILNDAEKNLRSLLFIGDNYRIVFLQGGGTLQFSMVPLNLLRKSKKADYVVTGSWSKKAFSEAEKYGDALVVASSEKDNFTWIPKLKREDFRADADYVHITHNNTIYGTRFSEIPDTGDIPLVADMSSSILSQEIDVSKFGLIYAGAQKNIGPSGVTIAIIREDIIGHAPDTCPTYLDYKIHVDNNSLYNTPPCFGIYIAGEVFKLLLKRGGVKAMEEINQEKASLLYRAIEASSLYTCPVNEEDRSLMNVVFVTGSEALDKKFVSEAKAQGMINLGGHRSIGGMRASIYNAMPMEGVKALVDFMDKFEKANK